MNDLTLLAEQHLSLAHRADHGRSAHLFLHDGPLRQSVIALIAGAELEEHNAPPAASLHVLRGRVRLHPASGDGDSDSDSDGDTELAAGQVMRLPQVRHGLTALDDAVLLLTSVTATPEPVVVYDTRRVHHPA